MKIGQWLASRPDLIGKNVCDRLSVLNTKAPAHPLDYTLMVIKNELSELYDCDNIISIEKEDFNAENRIKKNKVKLIDKIKDFFGDIYKNIEFRKNINLNKKVLKLDCIEPIGSGCIAQVYKAKIGDIDVAIKILHPKIEEGIEKDTADLYKIIKLVGLDSNFLHQFIIDTKDQTDLRNEAKNLKILGTNFEGNKLIKIPRVYYKSKNIIIEEYVKSHKNTANISVFDKNKLIFLGQNAVCKMIFKDAFFHADLHSGNINIIEKYDSYGLVLFDAGICRAFTETEHKNLLDLLYEIIFRRDYYKAAELLIDRKEQLNLIDRKGFCRNFEIIMNSHNADKKKKIEKIFKLLYKHKISLDYGYSSLLTTLTCFDGFMRKLSNYPYNDFLKVFWINAPYKYFINKLLE